MSEHGLVDGDGPACGPIIRLPATAFPVHVHFYGRSGNRIGDATLKPEVPAEIPDSSIIRFHFCIEGRVRRIEIEPSEGESYTLFSVLAWVDGSLKLCLTWLAFWASTVLAIRRLDLVPPNAVTFGIAVSIGVHVYRLLALMQRRGRILVGRDDGWRRAQ